MIDRAGADITAWIHPGAELHHDCHVGAHSVIWQFASVIRGAVLGVDCSIGAGATIDGARMGDRCIVASDAFLPPGILLQDDVFVGPGARFCNDAWPAVDKSGFNLGRFLGGNEWCAIVECGVSIGASVTVLPGVRIGAGCVIAAGVVVTRDVPPAHVLRRDGSIELKPHAPQRMRIVACSP